MAAPDNLTLDVGLLLPVQVNHALLRMELLQVLNVLWCSRCVLLAEYTLANVDAAWLSTISNFLRRIAIAFLSWHCLSGDVPK